MTREALVPTNKIEMWHTWRGHSLKMAPYSDLMEVIGDLERIYHVGFFIVKSALTICGVGW